MHPSITAQNKPWLDYRAWRGSHHTVAGNLFVRPQLWSPQLHNYRTALVYLPPSYFQSERRYPVLYMHDGQNLFDRATAFVGQEWEVDETLEKLSREGIEAIVVGLYNHGNDRLHEYNPFRDVRHGRGEDYITFIADTVKPQIDHDFRTQPERQATGIMGSSMGGLISIYGFFQRPDVFGLAGVMSPSVWFGGSALYDYIRQRPYNDGRIYLDNGTRENSARKLNALLHERGYRDGETLKYVVEHDGEHTESAWARRLPDALRFLLS
jgi:predicted alpha/beta superfamily hydrolase